MITILRFLDHSKGGYTLGTSGIVEITTAVQLPTVSPTDSWPNTINRPPVTSEFTVWQRACFSYWRSTRRGLSADVQGVVISDFLDGSPAADAELQRGNVIEQVDPAAAPVSVRLCARL